MRVEDVNDNAPVFNFPNRDNKTLYATIKSEERIARIEVSLFITYVRILIVGYTYCKTAKLYPALMGILGPCLVPFTSDKGTGWVRGTINSILVSKK